MSRVAKKPIALPKGVSVSVSGAEVSVKGAKGSLSVKLHPLVRLEQDDATLVVMPATESSAGWTMAGTFRALINNMVEGVSNGFKKKLELVGVGYRAQSKGATLSLSLGFSHPVEYPVPEGITVETPSQTEVIVSGCDRQKVGQVAAEIRDYRPPEPYKGKGIRYAGEQIVRKEAKKK